jgi:hypothetical protein
MSILWNFDVDLSIEKSLTQALKIEEVGFGESIPDATIQFQGGLLRKEQPR